MDRYFRVEVVAKTANPQQVIYTAMHQDYAEGFVWDERDSFPDEVKAGEIIVRNLLAGNRGHFGCLEHPAISFNCGWFPHSAMQQARTHRVSVSFDVQSGRYTGQRVCDLADACDAMDWESVMDYEFIDLVEKVFYLRPVGYYTDRQGAKYEYTQADRQSDAAYLATAAMRYRDKINAGYSEEHARGLIPFDVRQHFVVSFNARSLMHFLDLRAKQDAQLEIVQLCELIWPHFEAWVPAIAEWYKKNRWGKARLAP